ncbi:hypothetical protein Taro_001232, partial [Colocasia esculenta]|nr:hypothetical protein [Colocasia esculenta]
LASYNTLLRCLCERNLKFNSSAIIPEGFSMIAKMKTPGGAPNLRQLQHPAVLARRVNEAGFFRSLIGLLCGVENADTPLEVRLWDEAVEKGILLRCSGDLLILRRQEVFQPTKHVESLDDEGANNANWYPEGADSAANRTIGFSRPNLLKEAVKDEGGGGQARGSWRCAAPFPSPLSASSYREKSCRGSRVWVLFYL